MRSTTVFVILQVSLAFAALSGKIVYVSFDEENYLKEIDLANPNSVSQVFKFPDYPYPQWSESSATNQGSVFFYDFLNVDLNGTLIGFDVSTKKQLFSHKTPYFWRLAFDPRDPEFVYGLAIDDKSVYAMRVNITSGERHLLGQYPDGLTNPQNSAVYDPDTRTFYAYIADDNYVGHVVGLNISTSKIVSKAAVNTSIYVCEAVKDETSGTFYGLIMDYSNNAWLAKLDVKNGQVTPVGTTVLAVSSCDAGAALSSQQRVFYAYVKGTDGNSNITAWNLDSGDLIESFNVENAVFGLQLFA